MCTSSFILLRGVTNKTAYLRIFLDSPFEREHVDAIVMCACSREGRSQGDRLSTKTKYKSHGVVSPREQIANGSGRAKKSEAVSVYAAKSKNVSNVVGAVPTRITKKEPTLSLSCDH